MRTRKRFPARVLAALRDGRILGVRAGSAPHRFIGVWVVVAEGRVFVRSWDRKAGGWWRTFLAEPRGIVEAAGKEIPVRAVRTRSARLYDAVDRAYAEKYDTPGALAYVRGFRLARRRATTTELVPL